MKNCLLGHKRSTGRSACLVILAAILLGCTLPRTSSAFEPGASLTPSTTSPFFDCPGGACDAISDPPVTKTASGYQLPFSALALEGGGENGGYDPQDLQSAYSIPTSGGSGQTVAVVDAGGDSTAESDLAKYREKYKLPDCNKANGCFKKVNQKGEEGNYPANSEGWAIETSLDLDMVSAACSECHILLVEASGELPGEVGASVVEAAKLGATEISNSYGYPETYAAWCGETDCSKYNPDYYHPGIVITASAGDYKYENEDFGPRITPEPDFPASSPYVVAVGGTKLNKASNSRGWSEAVWNEPESEFGAIGTGSGCSATESKPIWQSDTACAKNRTDDDISSDAACLSPVSIYSTPHFGGWANECGTSASAPLVAGIEAHANAYTKALAADGFYQKPNMLFDIKEGANGTCTPPAEDKYLCTAETGYDGPTGWGTPDGIPTLGVWSDKSTENPSSESDQLTSVSCSSSSACTGVGSYSFSPDTLAERWNGTTWSRQTTPNPTKSESILRGVSCTSSTVCKAVGLSVNTTTGVVETLAESWNGTEWTIQKTPNPSGARASRLFGISCSSSSTCVAVGSYDSSSGEELTLAETWNGTEWTIHNPRNPAEAEIRELTGVSCPSTTSCIAVGRYSNPKTGYLVALTERWTGTEWTILTTPLPEGTKGSYVLGVSCSSSSACTAVGGYETSTEVFMTLAERWTGTEWVIQHTPNPKGGTETALTGISCSSTSLCTAVGSYDNSTGTEVTLAEGWNGVEWLIQEAADPPESKGTSLASVSCISSVSCSTVGWYDGHSGEATLAESGPE